MSSQAQHRAFRHQPISNGNLGRRLDARENRRFAIAPYVVNLHSLNQPSFTVPNQFDVIAVFHEVVPRVVVARQVLGFHYRFQICLVTIYAYSRVGDGVGRVEGLQRVRQR